MTNSRGPEPGGADCASRSSVIDRRVLLTYVPLDNLDLTSPRISRLIYQPATGGIIPAVRFRWKRGELGANIQSC